MPPQKNSGNKKSAKESGVVKKNKRFIQDIIDDIRTEGKISDVHIARVIKGMGNGRMEVFYVTKVGTESRGHTGQAIIRGSFRGKGKRSVWIENGSIVAVADIGLAGSAALEIMAVFDGDQIRDLRKEMEIDPRIFAIDNVDTDQLVLGKVAEEGFDFGVEDEDMNNEEIDAI